MTTVRSDLYGRVTNHVVAGLLEALQGCLFALDENRDGAGPTKKKAIAQAGDVLTKAAGSSPSAHRKPIVIEVRGGVVQEVLNVPPGYEYEVVDYDIIETDGGAV